MDERSAGWKERLEKIDVEVKKRNAATELTKACLRTTRAQLAEAQEELKTLREEKANRIEIPTPTSTTTASTQTTSPTYAEVAAQTQPEKQIPRQEQKKSSAAVAPAAQQVERQALGRWLDIEDLSQYEAEMETNEEEAWTAATSKALVVHGIACQQPIGKTKEGAVRNFGRDKVAGARWLLRPERRAGKMTSSMVIFFTMPVAFTYEGKPKLKLGGRWHLVEQYDFSR